MSVLTPNRDSTSWRADTGKLPVRLILSGEQLVPASWAGASVAGLPIDLVIAPADGVIEPDLLAGAAVAVVEVADGEPASIERFAALARGDVPLIAAVQDPQVALVRALVRVGAHDVIPLPLELGDLESSLTPLRERIERSHAANPVKRGKVITVIKSVGGVGATMLATQLAVRQAARHTAPGHEVALLDLDLQFGDAAFQLGLRPTLSLADLLDAGNRLDGSLLRATATAHRSGLHVIAAPDAMLPLDAMTSEQVIDIVDQATREFALTFVDLPTNWSNWSLSLIARSDLVLLVTEVNLSSLNRARRQLELLASQELGELDVRVVVNRFERGLFKSIRPGDVSEALGRDISFTIANDHALVRAAIDRGLPVEDIKRKSALAKDLDTLGDSVAAGLGVAS